MRFCRSFRSPLGHKASAENQNFDVAVGIVDILFTVISRPLKMSAALSKNLQSQNPGSLAGRVERAVAQWIFRGELTAGQKLTEQEVAERLVVSRGPVRELSAMVYCI
jgi:hypothetical protein